MHKLKTITRLQQLASLAMATLLTSLLLASLAAQANIQHANAWASAQGHGQLLCAAPQRATRS